MSKDIKPSQLIELEHTASDGTLNKFKTIIEDIVNDETFFLFTPMTKGQAYSIPIGDTVNVLYSVFNKSTNKDDVYIFSAELITKLKKGNINLIKIRKTSEPSIIQRRSFFRLNLVQKMMITYFIDGEPVEAEMLSNDISSGGMKFIFTHKLQKGEKVIVHIPFKEEESFEISGDVIHSEPLPDSMRKYDTRILFKNLSAKTRKQLTSYIYSLQAKYLKKIAYDMHEKNMNEVFKKNLYEGPDKRIEVDFTAKWVDYSKVLSYIFLFFEIAFFLAARPAREYPVARFFNMMIYKDWDIGLFVTAAIINIFTLVISASGLYCNNIRNKRSTDYISKNLIGMVIVTTIILFAFILGLGSIL